MGAVTQRMEYDAFGVEMSLDSVLTRPSTSNSQLPFRFSTKYTDSETALSYYGYRYYSAEVGRWTARDPIGEKGGLNVYGMVGNDAVNRGDNLGLSEGLQEFELGDDVTGDKTYTYVEACNVVVFLGHNGLVPQHEILNHPASAATNVSCGPIGDRFVPGRPQSPIPNVTAYNINPYTGAGSIGYISMAQGKAWASKAYTEGLAHARNTLCKSAGCCSKITVRVECRFHWFEAEPSECSLREVVDCALEN